nr:hypothetical protein [uncultured Deefgea sp.]
MRSRIAWCVMAVLLLSACKKMDDGLEGPAPIPFKNTDWRLYGTMPEFETWVDANSVKHEKQFAEANYTFVWMVQRYFADQTDPETKAKYRLKYARSAIHCELGRMAGVAVSMQNSEDKEIARHDVPAFMWEFTTPEKNSYGADFVRQICQIMAEKDAAAKE